VRCIIEWAIFIPRVYKLHLLEDSWIENDVFRSMRVKEIIQKLSGQVHFTRMYFGEEFCERAIPSFQDVQKGSEVALNYGLEFTLVTPYVTERGLGRLRKIFSGLLELGRQCEVIINDWGVLHLLSREYPDFIPVIGRQLNKAWRDPRCKNSAIPLTSLESEVMKNILKEKQANRIELDIPPQGLENLAIEDYELSLYFPYSIITSGRMCLIGSWGYDKSDKRIWLILFKNLILTWSLRHLFLMMDVFLRRPIVLPIMHLAELFVIIQNGFINCMIQLEKWNKIILILFPVI